MKAADIIKKISTERGIDLITKGEIDLVPLNDLNVHKREIWNLSVTSDPKNYFLSMNTAHRNKMSYTFEFEVADLQEGRALCLELSEDFGTPPCELSIAERADKNQKLYLAIHIHPEFSFTPKTSPKGQATQELVLHFV